tara:strand:+ start:717 stop:1118 length:402 start_codon:yes stop_codon:yes gene_type:complete
MVDTVTTQVLIDGARNYSVRLTNISDGTGEADPGVKKIDKSTLVGGAGTEPDSLTLLEADWSIQGFEAVRLSWDRTSDVTSMVMAGDDYRNLTKHGGMKDTGTGGTGDVLLTTIGTAVADDTYDITLHFKKKG